MLWVCFALDWTWAVPIFPFGVIKIPPAMVFTVDRFNYHNRRQLWFLVRWNNGEYLFETLAILQYRCYNYEL